MRNAQSENAAAPHLALIAVQILFGTWPIVGKITLQVVPPVLLVGVRVLGAALVLLVVSRLSGRLSPIKRGDWLLLIVSSMLGLVLNQLLFVKGLSLTTAINSTLLGTTIPVATLLVGIMLQTDRASWLRVFGIILAGAGVIYLIGPDRARFSAGTRTGDLLLIANSICYGAYLAVSKSLMKRYNVITVTTWLFIVACIPTIPAGAWSAAHVSFAGISWGVWLAVLYIILLPTVGAYYLNAWALARVPPSTVAVYIYLQPLIAFALAPLILHEKLSWRVLIASVLIFAGVIVVTRGRPGVAREVSEHP